MQTTFNLALNIVLKLNFLNTIFFMNFTGQILLKTKKDNSISRNILYSRVVTLMSFSFCWTWKSTQIHQKNLDDVLIWTYWWTVYFEEYKSTDLHAIENVFYLTSDHIIPFRLVRWKTLMLQSYERYTWSLVQYNHANHENERAHQWNCRLDYWICLETFNNVNCN